MKKLTHYIKAVILILLAVVVGVLFFSSVDFWGSGEQLAALLGFDEKVSITPDCSKIDPWFFELTPAETNGIKFSQRIVHSSSFQDDGGEEFFKRVSESPFNYDEIIFCQVILEANTQAQKVFNREESGRLDVFDYGFMLWYEHYFERAPKITFSPQATPSETKNYIKQREIMNSCVDFTPELRNLYDFGVSFVQNLGQGSKFDHIGRPSLSRSYTPPAETFDQFNRDYIIPFGDKIERRTAEVEQSDGTTIVEDLGFYVERYEQVARLNMFLMAEGYLKLPQRHDPQKKYDPLNPIPIEFMVDYERDQAYGPNGLTYGSGWIGPYQKQVNQKTNEAIKAFKIANDLPLVNKPGLSELDYQTRELIASKTGCKREINPILVDPLDNQTEFLEAVSARINTPIDRIEEVQIKALEEQLKKQKENLEKYPRAASMTKKSIESTEKQIESMRLFQSYFKPANLEYLFSVTPSFSVDPDAYTYPAPVLSCSGAKNKSFPYDFVRNNTCPYFSRGVEDKDNLVSVLSGLGCLPEGNINDQALSAGIKNFQLANNLTPTGNIDSVTGSLLDRMWSIPGINSIEEPGVGLPFRMIFDDYIDLFSTSPDGYTNVLFPINTAVYDVGYINPPKNTLFFLKTTKDSDSKITTNIPLYQYWFKLNTPDDFVPDNGQYYCPQLGPSPNHSIVVSNEQPSFLFGLFKSDIILYKNIKNKDTGKNFSLPMWELRWSSNNLQRDQRMFIFLDNDNVGSFGKSILLAKDIPNQGFYDVYLPNLPEGKYRIRVSTTVNSFYDISSYGVAGFIEKFSKRLIDAPVATSSSTPEQKEAGLLYKKVKLLELTKRILGGLLPPPTFSVDGLGPVVEIRGEAIMNENEYNDYVKKVIKSGGRLSGEQIGSGVPW